MAHEIKIGAEMRFGKRLTPRDDPSLTITINDATRVGVSRDEIQKIIDSFPEGLRTIDDVEHAIRQIGALKATFLENDKDDSNFLVDSTRDLSLVPESYEWSNERQPVLLTSDVAVDLPLRTDKASVPEGIELQHTFDTSAANAEFHDQNNSNAFGRRYPSPALAKTRIDNVAETGKHLRAVPFSEMLSYVPELVPGVIEKGVATMLYGLDGTHKSQLALQLGLCIQAGLEVFGKQTVQATFIYLDYKKGREQVVHRLQKMNSRLGLSLLANGYYHDFSTPQTARIDTAALQENVRPLATLSDNVHLEPFYHDLSMYLRAIPGHKFLVADSTRDILRFSDQAEINETVIEAALTTLNDLCAATDTTMLHLLRRSQSEKNDRPRMWENLARACLSVNKLDETKNAFVLRVEKTHNRTAGTEVMLQWSDGILIPSVDLGIGERKPV